MRKETDFSGVRSSSQTEASNAHVQDYRPDHLSVRSGIKGEPGSPSTLLVPPEIKNQESKLVSSANLHREVKK